MKKLLLIISSIFVFFVYTSASKAEGFFPKSDQIFEVLLNLKSDYVDYSRLDPHKMLRGSLENLSKQVPAVVIDISANKKFKSVTIDVLGAKKEFKINQFTNLDKLNNKLQEIISFIKTNLDDQKNLKNIDYIAINGFLSTLDPHTSLLIPEVYTGFKQQTDGNYSGVGMYIGIRDDKLKVISPISSSPAFKAGIQADDEILQINGEPSINFTVTEASNKIKGKVGSEVILLINRKEFSEPKEFAIIRANISLKSSNGLELQIGKNRIGYINITRFHQKTINDLNVSLKKVKYNLSDFQGIILDLRNNPGGILQQAIKVSDRFLNKGSIVSTAGVNNKIEKKYIAAWYNSITDIPIILLVNRGSASASEIVTAALMQNNRILSLGEKTFGKGSVQQLRQFKDGSALKFTISKYLTPNGSSIQSIGIAPNIEINPWIVSKDFVSIKENNNKTRKLKNRFDEWGDGIGESDLSLKYIFAKDFSHNIFEIIGSKEETAGFDLNRIKEDYLVYLAAKILKVVPKKATANQIKTIAFGQIEAEKLLQNQKLVNKLSKFDIQWSDEETNTAGIKTTFWVEEKDEEQEPCLKINKQKIIAGDQVYLCLELNNTSNQTTTNLKAISSSSHLIFDDREFIFGNLKPQAKKRWSVPISIPATFPDTKISLEIKVTDSKDKEIQLTENFFEIESQKRPFFHYTIRAFNEEKKKNIEAVSKVTLEVVVENKSQSDEGELTVFLLNGEGRKVFLTKGKSVIKKLVKNERQKINFTFDLLEPILDKKINLSLEMKHSIFRNDSIKHEFFIPYGVRNPADITNSAPEIKILNVPLTSKDKEIDLKFSVLDDHLVKDVYIFQDGNKKFYQKFNKENINKKISLSLKDGLNTIQVYSRDNYDVTSNKQIYILKQ